MTTHYHCYSCCCSL